MFGQCGLGDESSQLVPKLLMKDKVKLVACGSQSTFVLKENGELFVCGVNDGG